MYINIDFGYPVSTRRENTFSLDAATSALEEQPGSNCEI